MAAIPKQLNLGSLLLEVLQKEKITCTSDIVLPYIGNPGSLCVSRDNMSKYREHMRQNLLENGNKIDETYHVASCYCTRSFGEK